MIFSNPAPEGCLYSKFWSNLTKKISFGYALVITSMGMKFGPFPRAKFHPLSVQRVVPVGRKTSKLASE